MPYLYCQLLFPIFLVALSFSFFAFSFFARVYPRIAEKWIMAGDQKKSVTPPKFPPQKPTQFTVDEKTGSGLHTMPSITRLLNRKKLETQKPVSPPTLPDIQSSSVDKEDYPPIVFDLSEFRNETNSQLDSQADFQANAIAEVFPAPVEPPPARFVAKEGISLVLDMGEPKSVELELMNSGSSLAHVADPSASSNSSGELSGLSLGLSLALQSEQEDLNAANQEPILSSESFSLGDELKAPEEVIEDKAPKSLITKSAQLRFSASPRLHFWDSKTLKNTKDPLAEGIAFLLENGANSALFMALIPPPPQSPVPHFETRALAGDRSKEDLWTGMKWNPEIVPHVWNSFIRPGLIELSPPGTQTDQMSQRNVMRGALGLRMDEFLVLVRVGPEDACRGALAVVSKKSMVLAIEVAMKFLAQKAPDITLAA